MASDVRAEPAGFDESFFDAPAGGGDSGAEASSTPVRGKRKRGPVNSPSTVTDEDEVARRRRRRQSLAFRQRRKSLTLTSGTSGAKAKSGEGDAASASGSGATTTTITTTTATTSSVTRTGAFARTASSASGSSNRQYVSDMYSTIIKMSSENKINVKNSWSLHLIDHMEDILGSSRKENEEDDADDTYNFQKASCTLDASIKIYSYRVDDTWNSSYKILENLSRTDDTSSKQQANSDDDDADANEPKSSRKVRKSHTVAKTLEKNLNNINIKAYELEFEADPLFHKMSQSFDEGGAKGMLLANLGHYDGCKILLNSSDVGVSTRKPLVSTGASASKDDVVKVEDDGKVKKEVSDPNRRIILSSFGDLACFTEDVQSFEVCPPLSRLYKQLDEYYGDDGPQLKVKTTSEHLIKTPVKPKRLSMTDAPSSSVRARLDFDDMGDDASQPMEGIAEVDEGEDAAVDAMDVDMEDADTANDFDYGGGDDDGAADDNDGDEAGGEADGAAERADDSQVGVSQNQSQREAVDEEEETVEPLPEVLDASASAADFFKARSHVRPAHVKDEASAYTMMIESALLRTATTGGDDLNGMDDYSYFDVKMLRNWAGPVHWKFPAVRKVQVTKQLNVEKAVDELALMDAGSDGDDDESGASKEAPKTPRSKKAAAESKASTVADFLDDEESAVAFITKKPRAKALVVASKVMAKRQTEKATELVFPVDTHLDIGAFLSHFKKPKLRFFKRQPGQAPDANDFVSSTLNASVRENLDNDAVDFDATSEANDPTTSGNEYDYDGTEDADDDELYSTEGLISASRVVEKIDVHYERFAKRVDVKKLKHNIWDHLEKETTLLGGEAPDTVSAQVERLTDAFGTQTSLQDTTFESVVQTVADRVPPDVTVSFYFICMLHLANEKGLKLTGQDDLRNFTIEKDTDDE